MKCPACGNVLQGMTVDEVSVDVCRGGCGGIWFDNHELGKFDEPHEMAGEALLDVERNPNIHVDLRKKRNCPKCRNTILMRRLFSAGRQVEIDECPNCAGVWLDAGELATIRHAHASEQEREKAAEEYLQDVLGPGFGAAQGPGVPDARHRMSRVLRFLTPRHRFWH